MRVWFWQSVLVLLFGLIQANALPAHAGWIATLNDGCGAQSPWCPSVQAVCDYWGNFYQGGCVSIDGPAYSNGKASCWKYTVHYTLGA
jgi:hypothetical protein